MEGAHLKSRAIIASIGEICGLTTLELDPGICIDYAKRYSWQTCAQAFLNYLVRIPDENRVISNAA